MDILLYYFNCISNLVVLVVCASKDKLLVSMFLSSLFFKRTKESREVDN